MHLTGYIKFVSILTGGEINCWEINYNLLHDWTPTASMATYVGFIPNSRKGGQAPVGVYQNSPVRVGNDFLHLYSLKYFTREHHQRLGVIYSTRLFLCISIIKGVTFTHYVYQSNHLKVSSCNTSDTITSIAGCGHNSLRLSWLLCRTEMNLKQRKLRYLYHTFSL